MTEGGDTKDDLQLPSGTDEAEKLAVQIKADFDAGKELMVSVMKVRRAGCTAAGSLLCNASWCATIGGHALPAAAHMVPSQAMRRLAFVHLHLLLSACACCTRCEDTAGPPGGFLPPTRWPTHARCQGLLSAPPLLLLHACLPCLYHCPCTHSFCAFLWR